MLSAVMAARGTGLTLSYMDRNRPFYFTPPWLSASCLVVIACNLQQRTRVSDAFDSSFVSAGWKLSCQGLTLDDVVLDLRTPVFPHGQLYTALSRVYKKEDILLLFHLGNHVQPCTSQDKRNVYKSLLL